MERLWQHGARYAAAAGGTLGSCSAAGPPGEGDQPTGNANDSRAMAGWPIAQARPSNHTAAAIASGFNRVPRSKDLADAEFWTAAGLETVSDLRDV